MNYSDFIKQFGGYVVGKNKQPTGKDLAARYAEIETQLGALPADYPDFVSALGYHGFDAVPAFDTGQEDGEGDSTTVSVVLGLGGGTYDALEALKRIQERVPEGYLPIVADAGGNYVLLKVADGSVYFWDHETAPEPADEAALTPLASSLQEFVESWEATEELDEDDDE